jgi:hypothetical protein
VHPPDLNTALLLRKHVSLLRSKILPLAPKVTPFPEAQKAYLYSPGWRHVGVNNSMNAVPCRHGLARPPPTGKEKFAGYLASHLEVVINGFAGLLR